MRNAYEEFFINFSSSLFVEWGDKQNLANLLEKLAKLQQPFDMKIYENQLIAVIEWNMKTIAVSNSYFQT